MRKFWTRNIGAKILSFLVAVGLWFSVTNRIEFETRIEFPIEYENWPDGMTSVQMLPDILETTVRGKGKFLRHTLRNGVCRIDLADTQSGFNTLVVTSGNLDLPADVQVSHVDIERPPRILVEMDTTEVRDLPVRAALVGSPASGYVQVGKTFVDPAVVRVAGPRKLVAALTQLVTAEIDIHGDRNTVRKRMPIVRSFSPTIELSPETVDVGVTIEPVLRRRLEGVAVDVAGDLPEEWYPQFEPAAIAVEISGAHSFVEVAASQLASVLLGADDWSLGRTELRFLEVRDRSLVFVPVDSLPAPAFSPHGPERGRGEGVMFELPQGPEPGQVPPAVAGEVVGVLAVPRGVTVLGVHPQKLVVTLWEGVPDAPPLASSGTSP